MNHNSKRSTAKHPGVLNAAVFLLWWSAAIPATHAQQAAPPVRIDLGQAITLALAHNHALKATQSQIPQSQDQEVTAAIRPNPVFIYDDLFVPVFSPSQLNSTTLDTVTEFDLGLSYTFQRGHKRGARIRAAREKRRRETGGVPCR